VCGDPDTYVFFDSFQPPTPTHSIPARLRTATVPEASAIILFCDAFDPVRDSLDLWLFGLISGYTMGGVIHILRVIAIVVMVIHVIRGRRSSETFGPLPEKVRHGEEVVSKSGKILPNLTIRSADKVLQRTCSLQTYREE